MLSVPWENSYHTAFELILLWVFVFKSKLDVIRSSLIVTEVEQSRWSGEVQKLTNTHDQCVKPVTKGKGQLRSNFWCTYYTFSVELQSTNIIFGNKFFVSLKWETYTIRYTQLVWLWVTWSLNLLAMEPDLAYLASLHEEIQPKTRFLKWFPLILSVSTHMRPLPYGGVVKDSRNFFLQSFLVGHLNWNWYFTIKWICVQPGEVIV